MSTLELILSVSQQTGCCCLSAKTLRASSCSADTEELLFRLGEQETQHTLASLRFSTDRVSATLEAELFGATFRYRSHGPVDSVMAQCQSAFDALDALLQKHTGNGRRVVQLQHSFFDVALKDLSEYAVALRSGTSQVASYYFRNDADYFEMLTLELLQNLFDRIQWLVEKCQVSDESRLELYLDQLTARIRNSALIQKINASGIELTDDIVFKMLSDVTVSKSAKQQKL